MTVDLYNTLRKTITDHQEVLLRDLDRDYAMANKKFSVGDIISNGIKTIRIKGIKFQRRSFHGTYLPHAVYIGENLLKNGEVSKREPTATIYEGDNCIKL